MSSTLAWRTRLPASIRPYAESGPLAALLLGISSGFPYAMIGATLTTRLAQDGIDKKSVTAFALAFLVYNFKVFWAPAIDRVRLPVLGRLGQRRAWLVFAAAFVAVAVWALAVADPRASLATVAYAAVLVGIAGATFDIVIDAYRIELLEPEQLGAGSGMSQYGWRIGSVAAGALALFLASRVGWTLAYAVCAAFVVPAVIVAFWRGEPARRRVPAPLRGPAEIVRGFVEPFEEFFRREGAWLVLAFVLVHKIGDTLANLTLRLLLNDLGFTNDEIATFDVGFGFAAYLVGIFLGGALYARLGLGRALILALVLMAVSNLSFALLASAGHSNTLLAATITFENVASGIGGVVVVAYLSALCNLSFTASQFAMLSAAASILGRFLTGTTAGALIERLGYVDFYVLTTIAALPGVAFCLLLVKRGLVGATLEAQTASNAVPKAQRS